MPVSSDRPTTVITSADVNPVKPCDLTVVIVNYNVCTFLEQSLDSVFRAGGDLDLEVIVVDNDSVDGSVEMVKSRFPQVHLIESDKNLGFSKANNVAIAKARGRFIFVLNPDTIVQEDTFDTLLRFMDDHPDAGMVGDVQEHIDVLEQRECDPMVEQVRLLEPIRGVFRADDVGREQIEAFLVEPGRDGAAESPRGTGDQDARWTWRPIGCVGFPHRGVSTKVTQTGSGTSSAMPSCRSSPLASSISNMTSVPLS